MASWCSWIQECGSHRAIGSHTPPLASPCRPHSSDSRDGDQNEKGAEEQALGWQWLGVLRGLPCRGKCGMRAMCLFWRVLVPHLLLALRCSCWRSAAACRPRPAPAAAAASCCLLPAAAVHNSDQCFPNMPLQVAALAGQDGSSAGAAEASPGLRRFAALLMHLTQQGNTYAGVWGRADTPRCRIHIITDALLLCVGAAPLQDATCQPAADVHAHAHAHLFWLPACRRD